MTTEELIKGFSPDQLAAFIAARDELMQANAVQNTELAEVKDAQIKTAQDKHDADMAEKEQALTEARTALAAKDAEISALIVKYSAVIESIQNPGKSKDDASAELEKTERQHKIDNLEKQRDALSAEIDDLLNPKAAQPSESLPVADGLN